MWRDCQSLPTCPLHQQTLLFTSRGAEETFSPLSHDSTHGFGLVHSPSFFPSSGRESSSHFLRHRNSALFSSRRELEKPLLSLRIFGCRSHSCSRLCSCVFHTSFGGRCMSPCRLWPCTFSIVVYIYVFPCPCWEFGFFPICGLCNVAIVSL